MNTDQWRLVPLPVAEMDRGVPMPQGTVLIERRIELDRVRLYIVLYELLTSSLFLLLYLTRSDGLLLRKILPLMRCRIIAY